MSSKRCKQNHGKDVPRPSAAGALYVHVPYCLRKCRYCDFHSAPPGEAPPPGRWVRALRAELALRRECLRTPLESLFIGGGTPTALPDAEFARLLDLLAPLSETRTEWTCEANPGTLDARRIEALAKAGVSRVSIGAQSFEPAELELLGRIHTPQQTNQAVQRLRDAGIENLGLDLIYGIPNQTEQTWRRSLDSAVDLGIRHVSCYALSFEPGTPLETERRAGRLCETDDETQRRMYDSAINRLEDAGFEHYELSNFARAGFRCAGNLVYWRNRPYVGLGPAAVSYLGGVRTANAADTHGYVDALLSGRLPAATADRVTGRTAMAEHLMLELRLIAGVDRPAFARRWGADPVEAFERTVERYVGSGHLRVEPTRLRLTREALFVADGVLADFLAEA